MKIAVSGKGGTGKTTVSSMIVRNLVQRKYTPVLAVDADPNANMADSLGVTVENTVGRVLDQFLKDKDGLAAGVVKESLIDQRLSEILAEEKGFDLLSMGQGEGPGCYCYPNSIVRNYIEKLSSGYKHVVIDNEAGMEHISRRTNGNLDVLFLVSDPSLRGVRTCKKLEELIVKLGLSIKNLYLVINRVPGSVPSRLLEEVEKLKLNLLCEIPEDPALLESELMGVPVLNLDDKNPAIVKVNEMMKTILP